MEKRKLAPISFEDVRITFRNFSGTPDQYNPKGGKRYFGMALNLSDAEKMKEDGWNVKYRKPDEDDISTPYMQVAINYEYMPPKIYMVTKKNKVLLDETTVGQLDNADIVTCDVKIRPYYWEVNGNSGIKAYVKTMYVTIEDDEFSDKYDFDSDDGLPF